MARPKAGRSCSVRIRRACRSRKCRSAIRIPKVQLRLVDGDNRDADAGRAGDEMPGDHERLSQPARTCRRRSRRTASTSPATCSAATRTASTISSAGPTTCSSRAARTSIPADVERMLERHPDVAQAVVVPVEDDIKGTKPVAFVIPKAGQRADRGRDQAIRAGERAGLPAPALRLVRGRAAARLDQQGGPRRADARSRRSGSVPRR